LEKLEVGVAESGVMLALAGHFHNLEADRSLARLQMRRMQVKDCFILQRSGKNKQNITVLTRSILSTFSVISTS
jgi:hypothetical protein